MNEIIEKINNHKFLNNNDVITIIDERLKELNMYQKKRNVCFINEVEYMSYTDIDKLININPKYRHMILNSIISDELVVAQSKKGSGSTFLVDFYNISLLWHLFHELRHFKQLNILFKNDNKYNKLLKFSNEYLENNYDFYLKNHSLSLLEYDAEMSALNKLFFLLENLDLSNRTIYYLNIVIARVFLASRGYNANNEEIVSISRFHSPFELLKFLTNAYYGIGKEYDKK